MIFDIILFLLWLVLLTLTLLSQVNLINLSSNIFLLFVVLCGTIRSGKSLYKKSNNSHFPLTDEISNSYTDTTLVEDVSLAGTIKMLSRNGTDKDESENTVCLLTKYNGKQQNVDLVLSPTNHTQACTAYRDGKEVIVTGTLDKNGKYWVFSHVTHIEVKE